MRTKLEGKGNLRMGMESPRTAATVQIDQINQGYNRTPVVTEHARLMHVQLLPLCTHLSTSELSGVLSFLRTQKRTESANYLNDLSLLLAGIGLLTEHHLLQHPL